jgi:DNA-binding Xre family transcriptional regulator
MLMASIRSKARQLRLELQAKEGRLISMLEVSKEINMGRVRLNNIELGKIEEIATSELEALCSFYSKRLGRVVDTNEVLGYDPTNRRAVMLGNVQTLQA